MIVYHGSYCTIEHPDISYSRDNLDFGKGFYVTDIKSQAESWAKRYAKNNRQAIVNIYQFDMEKIQRDYSVKIFDRHNEEWLDFIISCRSGQNTELYDVIIGGIANDRIYDTMELYFNHLIDKKEAIKRLMFYQPNNQLCITNQKIIENHFTFVASEVVCFDGE